MAQRLSDGRLHLQHGPIDLVILGSEAQYERASLRFGTVLEELVAELPLLRTPVGAAYPLARGKVARRMIAAVWPHRAVFVTPMAAVAGAVADEILEAMQPKGKAYVNNGGDIAVHLPAGESFDAGIVNDLLRPRVDATIRLQESCGVATSGWRGRSHSLGVADAVTVVAQDAAAADAAATLVANAVTAEHPAIRRLPARALKEDSDLGDLPVTVEVGPLPPHIVRAALDAGVKVADAMRARGLIRAAYLALQNRTTAVIPEVHFPALGRST
ncbi:MAG TPA: UPF0280 family protein [Burkholderiales bacterium]|nr:UPF0280 family protein [Burkholderiales bacterium]